MWCLAIAATCGRWVILITCEEEEISFKSEPTSEATLPLIPESISSKIIVEILLNVDETYFIASATLDSSPPDENLCRGKYFELLFTEIITNDYLDNLNEEEIVSILSLFIQSKQTDDISIDSLEVPLKIKTNISAILEIATKFENTMSSNKLYINIDWNLSINSVDYMYKWCQGEDFNVLIKKYKI